MFAALFGGGKKDAPAAPPPPPKSQLGIDEVKRAKMLNDLNMQVAKLDEEIENLNKVLDLKESEVKQLVAAKKKTQAMTKLQEVKGKRELIAKKEMIRTTLVKTKVQIETQTDNEDMYKAIKGANEYLKSTAEVSEKIIEEMEEFKQTQMEMKQNDEYLKQILAPDAQEQKDLEDELKQYEDDLKKEEADKVAGQLYNIQPTGVPQAQTQPAQKQPVQASHFEDKMANLMAM